MPTPIVASALGLDLSPRVFASTTVAASPSAATETTVCTLTVSGDIVITDGIYLFGWCAFTVGTTGDAVTAKIRRTGTSGTTVATSGATNEGVTAATQLGTRSILGKDALGSSVQSQVYVLTLTVANAVAASTVSAAGLFAIVV